MIKPRYPKEQIADLGEALFERDIAVRLGDQHPRYYVAIDVHSGEYEVDAQAGYAMRRLLDRQPGARCWLRRVGSSIANGISPRFEPPRIVLCDLFDARVEWDGESRPIDVLAPDIAPFLGMELLGGHQLRIDVVDGGAVRITPLTSSEP